ncbi:homeobox-leucine zipper protein HOX32-like [Solanum pennellii]|uniref:Homeobox-leucine zipper protein HOX32-like n=1 Tax=Solanum pennellii TaxID=28526 RepID=A0ABM1VD91_SOLPN|nr:homeobox-leucine zipper protein HOX32-like [Solanum pennellii]
MQLCSGAEENPTGVCAKLVFAHIDESFDDDPLLPLGFSFIPLEPKSVKIRRVPASTSSYCSCCSSPCSCREATYLAHSLEPYRHYRRLLGTYCSYHKQLFFQKIYENYSSSIRAELKGKCQQFIRLR